MSIAHFPGAVNADLGGYAGNIFQRSIHLIGACVCFIISGGDLEALADDLIEKEKKLGANLANIGDTAERAVERAADRRADQVRERANTMLNQPEFPHPDDPLEDTEPHKVYHRAITSLFAGTAPEAGKLTGKVSVSKLSLTYGLTGNVKYLFSISLPGHASHFQVGRGSVSELRKSYGTGVKRKSRTSPRTGLGGSRQTPRSGR